jgi:hypothetical protein
MGRARASRKPSATTSDGSKMLSNKHSTIKHETNATNTEDFKPDSCKQEHSPPTATTNAAHPKPHLTIQERLQDQSLLYWHQPIDQALELHLHGLLAVTGKIFTPDTWMKWPKNYCRAMIQLVELVSPAQANELLTAKMARTGLQNRAIGTQPRIIWEVVEDVKKRLGLLKSSMTGSKVAGGRIEKTKTHGPVRGGVNARGSGKSERGGKSNKI